MLLWKDTTSYSRDKDRVPTCWTADVGSLRLTVACGHIYYPGQWVMHFRPWFDTKPLKATSRDDAQAEALSLARDVIREAHEALHPHPGKS